MANPSDDSAAQNPRQGGQNPTPRNPGQAPRPRMAGEGPSGGSNPTRPPVPRQGATELSRARVTGVSPTRPTIQGFGGGGGGEPTVGGGFGPGRGAGGGVAVGAAALQIGGAGIAQRKRIREGDPGAGPSRPVGVVPPPLPPPPAVAGQQFICQVCRREFRSDRGLCGHLRTHGDRQWRGAFPPPTFSREEFYEAGVGNLLNPPLQDQGDGEEEVGEEEEEEGGDIGAVVEEGEIVDTTGDQAAAAAGEEEPPAVMPEVQPALPPEREKLDLNEPSEEAMAAEAAGFNLNETPERDEHGNYL